MSDSRINAYAEAVLEVRWAEGQLNEVEDELFRFARALEGSDELRNALTDPHLPASRRQQIVEDLLGGKASTVTRSLVSMMVANGRAGDIPAVGQTVTAPLGAAASSEVVAEVRSAVELTDDQHGPALREAQRRHRHWRSRFATSSTPACSAASSPRSATTSWTARCARVLNRLRDAF